LLALDGSLLLLGELLGLGISSFNSEEVVLRNGLLDLGLLVEEAVKLLYLNSNFGGLLKVLKISVALFGKALTDILVHVELIRTI